MRDPGTRNVVDGGTVAGSVVQAGHIGQVTIQQVAPPRPEPSAGDPWVGLVRDAPVWRHVPGTRDPARYREAAASAAAALARLRDGAEERLTGDPWQDPRGPERFAERLEWLLGEPDDGAGLDLYPAEAALFALVPLLARVHDLRMAADRLHVEPWRPGPAGDHASPERAAFEAYADGHGVLVQRALLRPDAAGPIGWWLFHRWLLRHEAYAAPETVRGLLDALGEAGAELGDVLAPDRVGRVLHGLRRGPHVCNPEFLGTLPPDDPLRGPGLQRVRDQRLVLLASLAYALTPGTTTLPDVVAEHLGIPHPVDPAALRTTLEGSSWGGSPDLPVLRAECSHEAVVEGLRSAVGRMDEVLHAVTRTVRERVTQPMPRLPVRLSADGVTPIEGAFTGWASFRLDERRVRDLLMGVQLYKDRDLAIRELYQNALDACRYRRARTEYLDRTHPAATYAYEGSVVFEQGVDGDGRAYVECRDDGIGMGEAELRGVFSQAGARFAEQPDFREEQADWARLDPPVRFHPNSRFGIGVLSYFMLADELRVTTCRMDRAGLPGPVLEASIFGPGHLFRIVRRAERGERPGTTVRLYLRDAEPGWSCPEVLARLLGVAEFPTVARHGTEVARWTPGVLRERERREGRFGLTAQGVMEAWPDAPPGSQVFWCARGGGLLVDGLVVYPDLREGVLSRRGTGLVGAVVNLSGPFAPERLSADRALILDDVRDTVRDLLAGAVGHLLEGRLLAFRWLSEVTEASEALADLVVERCIALGRDVPGGPAGTARTGFLPNDVPLLFPDLQASSAWRKARDTERMPDHLLLWRLIAHRSEPAWGELLRVCPELADAGEVAPALPSDRSVLELDRLGGPLGTERLLDVAAGLGRSPRAVALRATALGLYDGPCDGFPDPRPERGERSRRRPFRGRYDRRVTPSHLVRTACEEGQSPDALASRWRGAGIDVPDAVLATARAGAADDVLGPYLRAAPHPWFEPGAQVPPGLLVVLSFELGRPLSDLCPRLRACGIAADPSVLPDLPPTGLAQALSERLGGMSPWLNPMEPIPPSHVLLAARELGLALPEAAAWFERLGFPPPQTLPDETEFHDLDILTPPDDPGTLRYSPLRPGKPVLYTQLLAVAAREGLGPAAVASRMRAYGLSAPALRPVPPSELDGTLFAQGGPLDWQGLPSDAPVPFARVVAAAGRLLVPPAEIAARLAEHGIACSCADLPEGLSYERASALVARNLPPGSQRFGLQGLLEQARALGEPVERIHRWLVALGVDTVDPAEAVRAALPRVPRP
ncbi:wHTH domain-containing protein [Streptomyces roseolilacinus]|uniref:wHTH domain-containing protein n=1 Tax=Streptomyces roseolilacinus TaxID=66904 RepID=UPI00380AB326